jgi:triosephosphate isomerase (TIM)
MKYVIANWKMKMSLSDVGEWFFALGQENLSLDNTVVVVVPSFVHVPFAFLESEKVDSVFVGAQDVSVSERGSHTGDVGAFQLKDFCDYCVVGHSERDESMEDVILKRDHVLEFGMTPIVCFTKPDQAASLFTEGAVLAWEDPTNISQDGVFNEKPFEEISSAVHEIRNTLPEDAKLLYGGSVNSSNIADLVSLEALDGVLVGQASLDFNEFLKLIEAYEVR